MVSIAPASPPDLRATSELHHRALEGGLFPDLGPRFLRHYHRTFVASPHAVALVASEDGRAVGFVLGTTDNAAHYRWTIRRHGWRLALAGLLAMLVRPRVAVEFLRTRVGRYVRALARNLRPRRPRPVAADDGVGTATAAPTAILTHIATDERRRSKGVGRRLADEFLQRAEAGGAGEARLITPLDGDAVGFYARLGWRRVADRGARDGSAVREFRMPLPVADR